MKLNTSNIQITLKPANLTEAIQKEMYWLYRKFYRTSAMNFYQEIKSYDYCSLFRSGGQLIGFMGIQVQRTTLNGKVHLLFRLSEAIILEDFRGKGLLQKTMLKLGLLFWRTVLTGKVFCWANAYTYKSYLAFAKSVDQFYPNYQQATPYQIKDLMDVVGEQNFCGHYEAPHGVVRNNEFSLKDNSNWICYKYQAEPHIRFFSEVNPGYETGSGLITIAPLNLKNIGCLLKKIGRPFFFKSTKQGLMSRGLFSTGLLAT